jgi:peptidoglycan hydrolase CwlO-like protein
MKINKTYILLLIVAGIAVYSLFQANSIKTDLAGYYRKIDSLQNEIDSVQNENKILDNHIATVDQDINKVEGDIINVNKNITVIKNNTNEKVTAVNDYTIHDLLKFFADRYENGLDSTAKSTDSQISH